MEKTSSIFVIYYVFNSIKHAKKFAKLREPCEQWAWYRESRDEMRKKEEKTEQPHSQCLMHNDAAAAVVTQEYFLRFN